MYSNSTAPEIKNGTMLFDTCSEYAWYEGAEKPMQNPLRVKTHPTSSDEMTYRLWEGSHV